MTSASIAEVLGGRRILGRQVRTLKDLAEIVRKGLPADALAVLGARLELNNIALSGKVGIPARTLSRRFSRHSRLTAAESDRAVRMARVYATAVEMIGNAGKAAAWLRTPNRALGGGLPIDQLDTDLGAKEVENILGRIAYGVYS
ncbi:MAG TPA: antitoxin Xre/MbcA/ParS toxin-binding domain-containing protein [Bryobacteraceae bacterium]|nr:antitoxin Xre/MbcA/ParS toxin-binding domain-containing protein [Bryobacteraceae bacterium]